MRNRTRARNIERIGRAKRAAMRMIYQSQLRLPLDENLAVFSAYWSRGYSCNPAAIDAELARLAPHIRRVWAVRAEHVSRVPKGVEVVVVGSREYWTALARGTYFINNVNFADALVKREGQIHLQTHHGTPLKTMGLDQANYPASTNMDMEDLLRRCDRWDYSISSNRFSTSVWERVYPCTYTSLETGYPRNDVLINSGAREVAQARRELGAADGSKVFLYMPTHREYQKEFTRGSTWRSWPRSWARKSPCWCAATTSTSPRAGSPSSRPAAGSSTSPRTRTWSSSTWRPTRSSPTTPRRCSTTPTSTGRS